MMKNNDYLNRDAVIFYFTGDSNNYSSMTPGACDKLLKPEWRKYIKEIGDNEYMLTIELDCLLNNNPDLCKTSILFIYIGILFATAVLLGCIYFYSLNNIL